MRFPLARYKRVRLPSSSFPGGYFSDSETVLKNENLGEILTLDRRSLSSFLSKNELARPIQHSRALEPPQPTSNGLPRAPTTSFLDHHFLGHASRRFAPVSADHRMTSWIALEAAAPAAFRFPPPPSAPPVGQVLKTGTGETAWIPSVLTRSAEATVTEPLPAPPPEEAPRPTPLQSNLPSCFATLASLARLIRSDLESNLTKLTALNRSRRESVLRYLELLASVPSSTTDGSPLNDDRSILQAWIDRPASPARARALRSYVEEVSLIALAQVLILKVWSDRGLRPMKAKDLTEMNWVLSDTLRKFAPLDREGWQLTRQNIYAWYCPPSAVCAQIWKALESLSLASEGPELLATLFGHLREAAPEWPELRGYDPRFFSELWKGAARIGFEPRADQGIVKRAKTVFCPTLRDGRVARHAPAGLQWAALENHPFQLLSAELAELWSGPAAPALWTQGTGLEVHPRDQLSLSLSSVKPSALSRVGEMDACDLAIIFEERSLRMNGRSAESQRLRAQVDGIAYLKKLREPGATLGNLQAAVAIAKLRPGASLLWFREEALGAHDGTEVLRWMLDRARLIAECDLSQVKSRITTPIPLFPKFCYVFKRDIDHQARPLHTPHRVIVHGQITSHVEVEQLLGDVFTAVSGLENKTRGHWRVVVQAGASPQKDWADHWPTQTDHDAIAEIERMRASGTSLATLCTVRPASGTLLPKGARSRGAIWLRAGKDSQNHRTLHVEVLGNGENAPDVPPSSGGLVVVGPTDDWTAPLAEYLRSTPVRKWIDHHAERRGDKWNLSEQVVKFIPVPKSLVAAIQNPGTWSNERLPLEWRSAIERLDFAPRDLAALVPRLEQSSAPAAAAELRTTAFVLSAQARARLSAARGRMRHLVNDSGDIKWRELLCVLPAQELVSATTHPQVEVMGNMPVHLPITRITRLKSVAAKGLLFVSESGFQSQLMSENPRVLDILEAQTSLLEHPTWTEIVHFLKLPRRIELAETAAHEILLSHAEHSGRIAILDQILERTRP